MASGPSPKKAKRAEDILRDENKTCFLGQRKQILPGIFTLIPESTILSALSKCAKAKLYPVSLKTAEKFRDKTLYEVLSRCSKQDLQFSKIENHVGTVAEVNLGLQNLLFLYEIIPRLNDFNDLESSHTYHQSRDFAYVYCLVKHMCDVVRAEKMHLKNSRTPKTENNDHNLWTNICRALIVGNNVVYEECHISSDSLPHGDLDIVAGNLDQESSNWKIAVETMSDSFKLDSPVTVSAKTRETSRTEPPTTQIVFETLAFSEVLQGEGDEEPVVVFAGTREAFRPYIRLLKHDILLTTEQVVEWWDPNDDCPQEDGLVLLIVLMLAASSPGVGFQFSYESLSSSLPKTGWKEYYSKAETKYGDIIFPRRRTTNETSTPKRETASKSKIFANIEEVQLKQNLKPS